MNILPFLFFVVKDLPQKGKDELRKKQGGEDDRTNAVKMERKMKT